MSRNHRIPMLRRTLQQIILILRVMNPEVGRYISKAPDAFLDLYKVAFTLLFISKPEPSEVPADPDIPEQIELTDAQAWALYVEHQIHDHRDFPTSNIPEEITLPENPLTDAQAWALYLEHRI